MIRRFGVTERALHWVHATGFLAMLATGLVLYLPVALRARRPPEPRQERPSRRRRSLGARARCSSSCSATAAGCAPTGARSRRSTPTTGAGCAGGAAPQGRFNAGQKLNALLTAAFALLFVVSGFFLWLGERDHRFLFDGTGTVHELLTLASVGLLVGHLYLAVIHPSTRHALRGITLGDVREDWAREHHAKWVETERGL